MNEATQRLLPAGLLTLALHGTFLSWQMENQPMSLPKPEKIAVTLRQPPPPPPQQKIVKERLPLPVLKRIEHKPLETLPPEQKKIVKQRPQPPVIKPVQPQPLETLPPAQSKIVARRLPLPPAVTPAVLQPLATLPPLSEPKEVVWEEPAQEEIVTEEMMTEQPPFAEDSVQESIVKANKSAPMEGGISPDTGDQEAAPLYASNPPPEYPMQARRRGLQGTVIIEALIDVSGNVNDLRLSASSGHGILDKAALNSVRNWQFQPGTVGGKRQQMWVKVPVRFELH